MQRLAVKAIGDVGGDQKQNKKRVRMGFTVTQYSPGGQKHKSKGVTT